MFELEKGMTMENLVAMLDEYGWNYEWVMDQLYVSPVEEVWYAVDLTGYKVNGWERV